MKVIIACIFFACAGVSAKSVAQITLSEQNASLEKIVAKIKKQSGFLFWYESGLLRKAAPITVKLKNASISEIMDACLKNQPLTYSIVDQTVVITEAAVRHPAAPKQTDIRGKVVDDQGAPLIGATVRVKNSTRVAITDANGSFQLSAVSPADVLVVSYTGYLALEVPAGNGQALTIALKQDAASLSDIVVVGYGTKRKAELTGSVAVIDMKSKEQQTLTNASQALYGASGLWVNQSGAKPGNDGTTIRIRGVNTLSNANPLVLLDGVEYSLSEIDPNNIETITVLKDASAAIYGSKSSNGVILITSKTGKKGTPQVEYRSNFAIQQATYLPDVVTDPIQYMEMRNQAEINSGKLPTGVSYTPAQIAEYRSGLGTDNDVYPASDWFDIVFRNGFVQQHNLRASGGGDAVTYTMAGGYMDQKGLFIANDDAKRYSFDLKVDAQLSPRLKVGGSLVGNVRNFNEVGYGTQTVLSVVMRGLPIMSDYKQGELYGSSWLATPGRGNYENPRMEVEQGLTRRNIQDFLTRVTVQYKLPINITYDANLGYRKRDTWSKDYIPLMRTINNKTGEIRNFNFGTPPRVKEWDGNEAYYTLSHRLSWQAKIAAHHSLSAMVGQDYWYYDLKNFQGYKQGFFDNTLTDLNASTSQLNAQVTGSSSIEKLASFYSRLAYDFKDKYLLEATFRYDGSSRFAPGNQWSFFPSFLAGWRIDKEDFFGEGKAISLLKLRASYGKLGNQAVALYSYLNNVSTSGFQYSFGGVETGGAAVTSLSDRNIRWETTASYNIGLDMAAFSGKLDLSADVFKKRTSGILRPIGIPSQVGGLNGPVTNIGVVDNTGYEVSAGYRDQFGNVSVGINASASYVRNKVVDLRDEQIISGRFITKEGYPIQSYYLLQDDGYYQSQDEINNGVNYGTTSKLRPGYIKYVNQNGDKVINGDDRIITGSSIPKYNYSFGTMTEYKGFRLETQFQGVLGVDVYPTANLAVPFNNGAGVTKEWATDAWTESNRNAGLPLLTTFTDASENFQNSTFWLQNASYLRLKNIQLSYKLPQRLIDFARIKRVELYLSGQNLLTFSRFKSWDPELTITRNDLYEYPTMKSFTLGLNANF
ncbi:TonB-dependent receptor [Pedobacter yulinensis]|nr:TonB-dependent receptor [Pedobacter yulinensis]